MAAAHASSLPGAMVVDPLEIASAPKIDEPELEVLLFELKADIAKYLEARPGAVLKTLDDLVRFNRQNAADLTAEGHAGRHDELPDPRHALAGVAASEGLDYLERYPYGCAEQTTSTLFPRTSPNISMLLATLSA